MCCLVSPRTFDLCDERRTSFHGDESGMLCMVHAVAVMFCVLMIVMVINVAYITHQKIELQNAADATAYAGGLWQARGMNAITATNHVMGEMLSFVILHEAVGGVRLDRNEQADTGTVDTKLRIAREIARALGASTPAYSTVKKKVYADRTEFRAKVRLKKILTWIYYMKAAARLMQQSSIPPVVAAGIALEKLMDAFERVIEIEYKILNELHRIAKALQGLKEHLRDIMLPAAKRYTTDVKERTPHLAASAARAMARKNQARGVLAPGLPQLPLVLDPLAKAFSVPAIPAVAPARQPCPCYSVPADNPRMQIVKCTQLARASWPWVNYHRQPILHILGALVPWSKAEHFYHEETAGASKYLCDLLQRDWHDLGLYVLEGYPGPDKGYALWTEEPLQADRLFTTVGLAFRRETPLLGAPAVFHQAHPAGRLATAQVLLYNANEQERSDQRIALLTCKRIQPIRQSNVGWDTLNWRQGGQQRAGGCRANDSPRGADGNPRENRPFELVGIGIPAEFPQIQVNWQIKLVPVTSHRMAEVRNVPAPFRAAAQRLLPALPQSLRTH